MTITTVETQHIPDSASPSRHQAPVCHFHHLHQHQWLPPLSTQHLQLKPQPDPHYWVVRRVGARIQVTSHQPQIVETKINSDWSFIKTNHWSTDQALEYQKIKILTVFIWVNNHGTSPDNINLSSPESSERAKMTGILGLHIWLHQQKSPHLSAFTQFSLIMQNNLQNIQPPNNPESWSLRRGNKLCVPCVPYCLLKVPIKSCMPRQKWILHAQFYALQNQYINQWQKVNYKTSFLPLECWSIWMETSRGCEGL